MLWYSIQWRKIHKKAENYICCVQAALKTPYFLFQGKYYEQLHGAAMESQ